MVSGPVGVELLEVIASSKPAPVISDNQLQGQGPYRSLQGGASTLVRDLQVVAEQNAPVDAKIAVSNVTCAPSARALDRAIISRWWSCPARASSRPAAACVPVVAQPQSPLLISVPAQQPFPLLLASDKSAYRIGEKVALRGDQPAGLQSDGVRRFAVGSGPHAVPGSGRQRRRRCNQTMMIAGGLAAPMIIAGPAGTEQVLALCSTDAAPILQARPAIAPR